MKLTKQQGAYLIHELCADKFKAKGAYFTAGQKDFGHSGQDNFAEHIEMLDGICAAIITDCPELAADYEGLETYYNEG